MIPLSHIEAYETGRPAFATHLKPYLARLLGAIGLDVVYQRAQGDYLYYQDANGQEQQVLDMLGGFGASLFGHNHPDLVRRAREVLEAGLPFLAQASIRGYAGLLAERLVEMVNRTTGQQYVVTLANSGAEAVEAALKHAEMERAERVQHFFGELTRTLNALRGELKQGSVILPNTLYCEAARILDVPEIVDLDALEYYLVHYNQRVLEADTWYLAIKGAFHGKTTGALKLTHNPEFRNPWYRVGIQARFVPANDEVALRQMLMGAEVTCYVLVLSDAGEVTLEPRIWSRIVACLLEPIQGEGGIHELSGPFMQVLRAAADQKAYPLVIDEIQSGMGRSGTFLASEVSGVRGDYYLFSKSLGGGLAKLSAMLVERGRYIERFGYLHTSTFAEDDFSCAIALGTLELLDQDQGALIHACGEKGAYLLQQLAELQRRYPHVIRDVRGRGLMVGVELEPPHDSASSLLRIAAEQNLIAFLLSGYLLHEHHIRVAPTLSAHNTIRIEPSAYISYAELDRFCHGLEQAVAMIARSDGHEFARFLVNQGVERPPASRPYALPAAAPTLRVAHPTGRVAHKVACLAHFMSPEDVLHWDPTLRPLDSRACAELLERVSHIVEPFIVADTIVRSPLGERISLTVIGLPFTADQIMRRLRTGSMSLVVDRIEQGVTMAWQLGCIQVGFAGYTSIVTNNCLSLTENRLGLTSGNSLTAAAAIEATHLAAGQMGIPIEGARLGVVGGVGNIGRVLTEIEAEVVESIVLVGRPGTHRRLNRLAETIYAHAWERVLRGETGCGIARSIAQSAIADDLRNAASTAEIGARIAYAFANERAVQAPVRITTDLDALRHCNLIISATNAPEPIIRPEHLGVEPTVICDVSVPTDIDPAVFVDCPWVRVIKGGIMRLPLDQDLAIGGMDLPGGQLYACLSEVVLLGMAGIQTHFSYGPLRPERVRQIRQLARQHGFTVVVNEA